MKYTPSFGAALAKLGLLIPICVSGNTPSSSDFSSSPRSELFWSLDGDAESYCSGHLQEALNKNTTPNKPARPIRKKTAGKKKSKKVVQRNTSGENAPILCHGSAIYAGEHTSKETNAAVGGIHKTTICQSPVTCQNPIPRLAKASRDEENSPSGNSLKQQLSAADGQVPVQSREWQGAIEPDAKLKQVPELLCKPCQLTPKISTEPWQASSAVEPSSPGQDILHESAWGELIPSFANVGCERTTETAYNEVHFVSERIPPSSLHQHVHQPQSNQSIPTFVCEGNWEAETRSQNAESSSIRDDQLLPVAESSHRPSFDYAIPQFVVEAEQFHQTNCSGASNRETFLGSATQTEVTNQPEFNTEIPRFLNEPNESSGPIHTRSTRWVSQEPSTASSSEIEHEVRYTRQVPTFANEGCEEIHAYSDQLTGSNLHQAGTFTIAEAAHQPSFEQEIPRLVSQGHMHPSTTHSFEESRGVQNPSGMASAETIPHACHTEEVPHLIQESCVASPASRQERWSSTPGQEIFFSSEAGHAPQFEQQVPSYAARGEEGSATILSANVPVPQQSGANDSRSEIAHQAHKSDIPSLACSNENHSSGLHSTREALSESDSSSHVPIDSSHHVSRSNQSVPMFMQESCLNTQSRDAQSPHTEAASAEFTQRSLAHRPSHEANVPAFAADGRENHTTVIHSQATGGRLQKNLVDPTTEVAHRISTSTDVPAFACTSCDDATRVNPVAQTLSASERQATNTSLVTHQANSERDVPCFAQDSCLTSQGFNELPRSGTNIVSVSGEEQARIDAGHRQAQERESLLAKAAYHSILGGIVPTVLYESRNEPSSAKPVATAQETAHQTRFSQEIPPFAPSDDQSTQGENNGPSRGRQNQSSADSSILIKPEVNQGSIPVPEQSTQQTIAAQPQAHNNANSKNASNSSTFSQRELESTVPELVSEHCPSVQSSQPRSRNATSQQATLNGELKRSEVATGLIPTILSDSHQEGINAIARGSQGSIKATSATSEDTLVGGDVEKRDIPTLLTESCEVRLTGQPVSSQGNAQGLYPSGHVEASQLPIDHWVPELLRKCCEESRAQVQGLQGTVDSGSASPNTEIQRSEIASAAVPALLSECCDETTAGPNVLPTSPDSQYASSHTDLIPERVPNGSVPQWLGESNQQSAKAPLQALQASEQRFATTHGEIQRSEIAQNSVPQILGESEELSATAQQQNRHLSAEGYYATANAEIPRSSLEQGSVPQLLGESEELSASAQQQNRHVSAEGYYATAHADIPRSPLEQSPVPQLLGESEELSASAQQQSRYATAEGFFATADAELVHTQPIQNSVPEWLTESSASHNGMVDHASRGAAYDTKQSIDYAHQSTTPPSLPSEPLYANLSTAHPEIPHIAALLNARLLSNNQKIPEGVDHAVATVVDTSPNDPQETHSAPESQQLFAELNDKSGNSLTDLDPDVPHPTLEDLLANIQILQDKRQAEIEREAALQLGYQPQLFGLSAGLIAAEAQPQQDLFYPDEETATRKIGAAEPAISSTWNALEEPTLLTEIGLKRDAFADRSPLQTEQTACELSDPSRKDPSWSSLEDPSLLQPFASSAHFAKQTPVTQTSKADPMAKEWRLIEVSERPSTDQVLEQLVPQTNSDWISSATHFENPENTTQGSLIAELGLSTAADSPWTTWEAPSASVTKITNASFEPEIAAEETKSKELPTIWTSWSAPEASQQAPLWVSSEALETACCPAHSFENPPNQLLSAIEEPSHNSGPEDLLSAEDLAEIAHNFPQLTLADAQEDSNLLEPEPIAPNTTVVVNTELTEEFEEPETSEPHYVTHSLGTSDYLPTSPQQPSYLGQTPPELRHDFQRPEGFAGRVTSPQADRLSVEHASLYATPSETTIIPPLNPI